ncbi:hypothetical protein GJAV_G00219620 [Gymnothorax javanicus]|nr:hypothetical protein GJAV_G00219620 [Gymnothorax javanicus]
MEADSQPAAKDSPPAVTPPGPSLPAASLPGPSQPTALGQFVSLAVTSSAQLPGEQQDLLGPALFTRGTSGLPWMQEELDDIKFTDNLTCVLGSAQPRPQPAAASASPAPAPASLSLLGPTKLEPMKEEDDSYDPHGHRGYQHAIPLAHALVELRHQACVTQRQVKEIVALWQKLSDRDKAAISFPSRFMTTASKRADTPGVDVVSWSALGQSVIAAESPKANRMVEAIFLELCRIYYEGCTIAGVRVNRWGFVMRDYKLIRDNVYNSKDLMAAAPIQLFNVNHRTLLQWHKERCMGLLAGTMPGEPSEEQTAAEPWLEVGKEEEPWQPDQPPAFPLRQDTAGQAVTRCGPPATELYDIISKTASATAASSPSTAGTPAVSSAPAAPSNSAAPRVPRSTAWQRKIRAEQQQQAQKMGVLLKAPRKHVERFQCKRCGQPKTKEYGHSRYQGEHFCSRAEGRSVEDWLAEKRKTVPKKTEVILPTIQAAILPAPQPSAQTSNKTAQQTKAILPTILPGPQPSMQASYKTAQQTKAILPTILPGPQPSTQASNKTAQQTKAILRTILPAPQPSTQVSNKTAQQTLAIQPTPSLQCRHPRRLPARHRKKNEAILHTIWPAPQPSTQARKKTAQLGQKKGL